MSHCLPLSLKQYFCKYWCYGLSFVLSAVDLTVLILCFTCHIISWCLWSSTFFQTPTPWFIFCVVCYRLDSTMFHMSRSVIAFETVLFWNINAMCFTWCIVCCCLLAVLDQISLIKLLWTSWQYCYHVLPISFVGEFQELLDPQNGYVKGGSVTLEVHLVADDPEGLWWCNCTIQHGHALSAKMCLHVPSTKFWIRPSQHKVASYFLKTETGSLCNSYPYQPLVKTHNGEKECLLNSVRQKRKMHALR